MSQPSPRLSAPQNQGYDGVRSAFLIAAAVVGLVTAVLAVSYTGSAVFEAGSLDQGAFTRWGLPIAQVINDYAMATTIGALVVAVFVLPPRISVPKRGSAGQLGKQGKGQGNGANVPLGSLAESELHPAFTRALLLAQLAAVTWTLAAIAMTIFNFSDIAGRGIDGSNEFTVAFINFVTSISYGQAWLSTAILGAVVSTFAFAFRSYTPLLFTLILALLALVPKALIGHSASGDDHTGATNSIFLHLIGVSVWVGGLIAVAVVSSVLGKDLGAALKRYSVLALISYVVVVLSGVINASVRMSELSQLGSPWGTLVLGKTAAAIVLGFIGFAHRQWLIPQLERGNYSARRVLLQLIGVELVIMGAAAGLAVSLSRTAPPRSEELDPTASPARILTGYELPPELTAERMLSSWRWDWLFLTLALVLAVAYLRWYVRVRSRGDAWPVIRLVSWFAGLAIFTYVSSGAPAVYGDILISMHMGEHMMLTMVIPLLLVLASPVSLALKAMPARADGSRGAREWINWAIHTPVAAFLTNPIVAAVNFAASIIIFYSSDFFAFALREHTGHVLMVVHFMLSGYLFCLSMVGQDPVPHRAPYPMRLIILLATMAFHAFYGVALMGSDALLEASWFGNMGRDWGSSAIEDQKTGAGLMWAIGEVPTVAMAIGVAILWSRSDARESKRSDRDSARNNEAELAAYNKMFADLAQRDQATAPQHNPGKEKR